MTADDGTAGEHAADEPAPTTGEEAAFEAGIKFGSLYHQFAGTPVSPTSAASLAAAMEEAIENQPHCEDVQVAIREDALAAAIDDAGADYVELTGSLVDVSMRIEYEAVTVYTSMAMQDGYPLMQVDSVERE
jgi:hypothetical protein